MFDDDTFESLLEDDDMLGIAGVCSPKNGFSPRNMFLSPSSGRKRVHSAGPSSSNSSQASYKRHRPPELTIANQLTVDEGLDFFSSLHFLDTPKGLALPSSVRSLLGDDTEEFLDSLRRQNASGFVDDDLDITPSTSNVLRTAGNYYHNTDPEGFQQQSLEGTTASSQSNKVDERRVSADRIKNQTKIKGDDGQKHTGKLKHVNVQVKIR